MLLASVLPTSELPDVHGNAAIAPRGVPAVFGTGVCATGGSDVSMVVLSPDSYDLIRMTDHPFVLPPLDGASVMHPEDISVLLDMTDTVLTVKAANLAQWFPVSRERWSTVLRPATGPPLF